MNDMRHPSASGRFLNAFRSRYTKWKVIEVYRFSEAWYVCQARQNQRTGYKVFRTTKVIRWHYGHGAQNMTPDRLEALFNATTDAAASTPS